MQGAPHRPQWPVTPTVSRILSRIPIWCKDYSEPKPTENEQMQKETFLELLLSEEQQKLLETYMTRFPLSGGSFRTLKKTEIRHQDGPAQTNLLRQTLSSNSVPQTFIFPKFADPGSLKLFSCRLSHVNNVCALCEKWHTNAQV